MPIINRIIELIENKGMSQKEFCERTDIKPQTLSTWKKSYSDNVPSEKIVPIADVLNVPIRYLLTGEGERK